MKKNLLYLGARCRELSSTYMDRLIRTGTTEWAKMLMEISERKKENPGSSK